MRFASLGSGSEGNGLIVEGWDGLRTSRLLLDCGFTIKESVRRLERLGLVPEQLDAIVLTHEHSDHVSGAFKLARRYDIPVWTSHGTLMAVDEQEWRGVKIQLCSGQSIFQIGILQVFPFAVPHDAREPLQYVFSDGELRLGVLTDAGQCTTHIVNMLSGCDALVLECNHDRAMLENSAYPYALKRRISGGFGHLSNDVAAEILAKLDQSRLRVLLAAHLSRRNNTAELARQALASVKCNQPEQIQVADQDVGFDWINLRESIDA